MDWPLPKPSLSGLTCRSNKPRTRQIYLHLFVLCTAAGLVSSTPPHGCSQGILRLCVSAFFHIQAFCLQEAQVYVEGALLRLSGASLDSSLPWLVCTDRCWGEREHCCPWRRYKWARIENLSLARDYKIFHVSHSSTFRLKSSQGIWKAVLHPHPIVTDLSTCIPCK